MHAFVGFKGVVSLRHDIVVRRLSHCAKHLFSIVQNHFPVSPCYCGDKERDYLYVVFFVVSVWELYGVVFNERLGVVFLDQGVQISFQIIHIAL